MQIKKIIVGDLSCNCYLLFQDNNVLIIDPGDDYEKIKQHIDNKNIAGILITHKHFDHIGALDNVINDYQSIVYNIDNLSEKKYNLNGFKFEVIYTKGHTNDSVTYYFYEDNVMFTGDFLFKESIGRCDFENSSVLDMKKSIEKIKQYNDNIIIHPGHGNKTTLKHEKENNFYFNNEW